MPAPVSHLLTFILPDGAKASAARAAARVFDCTFEIGASLNHVSIYGRSREAVFAQAAKLLELACAEGRHSINANVYVSRDRDLDERRDWLMVGSAMDNWTIVVIGGQVAFAPTSLGAEFPLAPDQPDEVLRVTVAPARAG